MAEKTISGNIVDAFNTEIYPGKITISGKRIKKIERTGKKYPTYIMPGFVDSHIHIESSMLVPSEFSRMAVVHGTVAVVSDPHEIANVLGIKGVEYMISNAKKADLKFYFGAPSCVPATPFETSGATLGAKEVEMLLHKDEIKYLSEVMDYPGVINNDPAVISKINAAKKLNKKIDGHAPGLTGKNLVKYASAGISTDHECFTITEAFEKLRLGMKIEIREGSAAKNFNALAPLIEDNFVNCMFCSDDKHPDDLKEGHINLLAKRAVEMKFDLMKVLQCACVNPVLHYGLDVGLLQEGDYADFIEVSDLKSFRVIRTFINGKIAAKNGKPLQKKIKVAAANKFEAKEKHASDFAVPYKSGEVEVMRAIDGQLITERKTGRPLSIGNNAVSDVSKDLLKIAVVNRYKDSKCALGFVNGFNIKRGAIASSVAHDSHNIIAVGATDGDICKAVNLLIRNKGGIAVVDGKNENVLPLPVAGIMSDRDAFQVASEYSRMSAEAKKLGSKLTAPFMTLSFMALLVIPELKISDMGLFDSKKFAMISLLK